MSPYPPSHYVPSQTFWPNRYAPSVLFPRRYKPPVVPIPIPGLPTTWRTNFGDYLRRSASGLAVNAPTGAVLWSSSVDSAAENSFTCADIDGEGTKELVFGWYGKYAEAIRYGVGLLWKTYVDSEALATTLFDVDGDGLLEVFVSTRGTTAGATRALTCLDHDGTFIWRDDHLHEALFYCVMVEDIDGDGVIEVVQSDAFPHIKCFRADNGTPIWTIDGVADEKALLADIDQDGQYELLGSDGTGTIYIYRPDGTLKTSFSTGRPNAYLEAIEDVDGDGLGELIIPCYDGTYWNIIQVREPDGSLVIEIATGVAEHLIGYWARAIADLTGDGVYELMTGSPGGVIRCIRLSDGAILWAIDLGVGAINAISIACIDGDGLLEVLVSPRFVSDGSLRAYEPDGTLIWGINPGQVGHQGITVDDADGNGQGDLTYSFGYYLNVIQG